MPSITHPTVDDMPVLLTEQDIADRVAKLAAELLEGARDAGFDLAQGFHYFRPERPRFIDDLLAAR